MTVRVGPGAVLDAATRLWWRTVGKEVDVDGAQSWLAAPVSVRGKGERDWLRVEADRLGGTIRPDDGGGLGLLPTMAVLDGPEFDSAAVDPAIRDFYERTSQWRMDVWTQWTPLFALPGAAVENLFGRRVGQLALPVDSLDVAHGVDSDVLAVRDADGAHAGAAWIRRIRKTGTNMYSGYYRAARLPGREHASVHVSFPLEKGNVQVFLRPRHHDDGSFSLVSPPGEFGADGAYVTVQHRGRTYAARVPVHETFRVFVDADGTLRTDHVLKLFGLIAVRLHYKLTPVAPRA